MGDKLTSRKLHVVYPHQKPHKITPQVVRLDRCRTVRYTNVFAPERRLSSLGTISGVSNVNKHVNTMFNGTFTQLRNFFRLLAYCASSLSRWS